MKFLKVILIFALLLGFTIQKAAACACGCGVFNVATSALIPACAGGTAFLQYDYINQNHNWNKEDKASNEDNHHKKVRTQTVTAGAQYMFNRKWGAAIRVPYVKREVVNHLNSHVEDEHGDEKHITTVSSNNQKSVGDVRVNAIYSGFFADMSTGVTFGLKLPTADYKYSGFAHRDAQIGTGSADSIIGAYNVGAIDKLGKFNHFTQVSWQHALRGVKNYRIGDEISAAVGASYNAGSFGLVKKITPILQFSAAKRLKDSGIEADISNSGYSQIFFAPAIELNFGDFKTYADIGFPIYRNVNGNQLVADRIYKVILGYNF